MCFKVLKCRNLFWFQTFFKKQTNKQTNNNQTRKVVNVVRSLVTEIVEKWYFLKITIFFSKALQFYSKTLTETILNHVYFQLNLELLEAPVNEIIIVMIMVMYTLFRTNWLSQIWMYGRCYWLYLHQSE